MKSAQRQCPNLLEYEHWNLGHLVLGIDEAGRGPLAGPLSTAGVVFPNGYENPLIYDSKALSEKKRDLLYDTIINDALYFEIIEVSETDIDKYDIYHADQRAMEQIVRDLPCDFVITDAMPIHTNVPYEALVKGDQKDISVAAASILAKVTRDRIMLEYDKLYPQYGFCRNKGYPTKEHLAAIEKYGITPIHRRSFGPVAFHQEHLF